MLDIVDKAAVNLDLVNLQLLQPPQAGVAGAEVVHRDLNAALLPLEKQLVDVGIVQQLHALGDLQGQRVAGQAAPVHRVQHLLDDVLLAQLGIGHIDAHMEVGRLPAPRPALRQRGVQHPDAHRADQLALLQNGHKLSRRHASPPGRGVPQQGLGAVEPVGAGANLGLVAQRKALKALPDALCQVLLQLQGGNLLLIVLGGEEHQPVLSPGLGAVQGVLGILIEGLGIGQHILPEGHAAARQGTQPLQHPLGPGEHRRGLPGAGVREIDRKAVAVGAVNPPSGRRVLQHLGHPPEHRVAVLPAPL